MPQQRLTDRAIAPYITGDTLIHIVNTGDTTQYAGGSSYKATIDQVANYISSNYIVFSGGSGNCITDLYISNLYGCSPITIHDNLIFESGVTISSVNGGSQIELDYALQPSNILISTDNSSGTEAFINLQPTELNLGSLNGDLRIQSSSGNYFNSGSFSNNSQILMEPNFVKIGAVDPSAVFSNDYESLVVYNTSSSNQSTTTSNKWPVIVSSKNSTVLSSVRNSVILGGQGITASTNDTVYVDSLNINTIGGGTPIFNLGLDSSGNVVTGTTGGGSTFTGGTVPGETIFSNGLSATTISATTIGSSTDCIDDLYVYNIHSCSPLNINPLDEGNVYFGSTSAVTVDLSNNRVGIGTTTPSAKLNVSGTSYFDTISTTTGTTPSFRFLDGTLTPTDTTNIKSIYKEFRPTTTTANNVIGDGTLLYPNITSSSSAEFYASANLMLFTGNLSNLSSNEALSADLNVISIYTNTGTYNGIVKSSSAVLENSTAGGTIDKYVGFWANGLSADITHNGTTNYLYGFYMDNQSGRSGNVPATTNRYGVYIDDGGRNYFAGTVGIGTNAPSETLEVNGKTKTINFQMTSGATNGYVLTSDASGNASWQASSGGGTSIDSYNNVGNTGTTISWNVSGLSTNYEVTLTGNTTLNLSNVRNGEYGTIIVNQDAVGSRTITFGTINGSAGTHRVANGGGGSPTLTANANAIDILTFTYNGSKMFWTIGNDYT